MNGFSNIESKGARRYNDGENLGDKSVKIADKPSWNKYTSKPIQTKDKYDNNAKLDDHTIVITHISDFSK